MLELIIKYVHPNGNTFYIYSDAEAACAYLTISSCYICKRPHELVDLLVRSNEQLPPYEVLYECPVTHDQAELIIVTGERPC